MGFSSTKPQCKKIENKAGCIQSALCVLGDKWTPLLIGQLVSKPMTFGELELMLSGISPRTLSARLDMLQKDKIITRDLYQQHPPRYKYCLSKKGLELQEILTKMAKWGEKHKIARVG